MKIACVADLHQNLPEIPKCDLLLIGGDLCNGFVDERPNIQMSWINSEFKDWVDAMPWPVVGVAGNHDFGLERYPYKLAPMNFKYLLDETVTYGKITIHGSPWQPVHGGWAFNLDEWDLKELWKDLPEADIWLMHSPPKDYGDDGGQGAHYGSPSLRNEIIQKKPRLVVCGHIHSGYGKYEMNDGETIILNCSLVDWRRKPVNPIMVIEL